MPGKCRDRQNTLEWKEANTISLFKKGSRNKSEIYRQVNLMSVICKLLERLIKYHSMSGINY